MNKKTQKIVLIIAVVVFLVVSGYFVLHKKTNLIGLQSEPSSKTSTSGETTFLPAKIVSVDAVGKTFVVNYESRQAPFIVPTEFSVAPGTTIKKENNLLSISNLSVGDVVWIRAYEKAKNKYEAKNVIVTNDWRTSQVIIKKIETNKIIAEVFLPPHKRGQQMTLTIIPETEIKKGTAEEGENRKVVGLGGLVVGDIASVTEVGFGVHPADDSGPFYTTEIDVVSPYYCEQYLKPTGCIEQMSSSQGAVVAERTTPQGEESTTNIEKEAIIKALLLRQNILLSGDVEKIRKYYIDTATTDKNRELYRNMSEEALSFGVGILVPIRVTDEVLRSSYTTWEIKPTTARVTVTTEAGTPFVFHLEKLSGGWR